MYIFVGVFVLFNNNINSFNSIVNSMDVKVIFCGVIFSWNNLWMIGFWYLFDFYFF